MMGSGQRDRRRPFSLSLPAPRAPSSLSAVHPTPSPPNYVSAMEEYTAKFCEFLKESGDPGLSSTIHVNFKQLMVLGGLDLTIATCHDRHFSQGAFLRPAGEMFLKDQKFGGESGISFVFSDFPKSMQKLQDFLKGGDLVQTVAILGRHLSMDSPTARGRHFLQMLLAALFENYSKGIFLNGEFGTAEIVIFNYESPSQRRIEILHKPAEADKWTKKMCNEAKVKDMSTVADLIVSLYMKDGSLPLYFDSLIKYLQTVTDEEVGEPWCREFLCYHVAFMHSDGRKYLVNNLHSIYTNCKRIYIPFMAEKPPMYIDDWRKSVNKAVKDYIGYVLKKVYKHHITAHQRDPYDETVRGLMKFLRNLLEHCGEHIHIEAHHLWHIELCAANIFSEFLPFLVRTLLVPVPVQGKMVPAQMETYFMAAWDGFKCHGLR